MGIFPLLGGIFVLFTVRCVSLGPLRISATSPRRKDVKKIKKERKTVFFRNYSNYEGEAARLYRAPNTIREDILEIRKKIEAVDSMLNVRDILSAVIDEYADGEPEKWVSALNEIVIDAEETLDRLKKLRECLDGLCEELEDTVWALGN